MSQRDVEDAMMVFEWLLRSGKFNVVSVLLDDTDPETMDPAETLGILTITYHGKERLPRRDAFVARAEKAMVRQLGSERAMKLLETRR